MPCETDRPQHERCPTGPAQPRGPDIHLRYIAQAARNDFPVKKGLSVRAHGDFTMRAPVHIITKQAWQATVGHLTQVVNA
ncbi:hypothetical protein AA18890_1563 [Komagataeibacter europaeus LMG 18890]|nr:hypothetical protein [Komagataeibacter europaeus]GBQ42486.1 hypothetical protein AA18890_1563 [Komagataeibacter europaeus LMG 18890]